MPNSRMSASDHEEGGSQMTAEGSLSFGALIQQSAAALEKECAMLEARIAEKDRDIEELKMLCSGQTENITKQQSELEHLKVKTLSEEVNNETTMSKIKSQRKKLQHIEKYFGEWGKTIDPLMVCKQELEDTIKQSKAKQEIKEASLNQLEQEYKYCSEYADKSFVELQEQRDREKDEFSELTSHLKNQLEQQKQQERELEPKLREIQIHCRDKETMIGILSPQNITLKKTLEQLKSELAVESEQMTLTSTQLETALQEGLAKKQKLAADIKAAEQKINETNNDVVEKDAEVKMLESTQKQLNVDQEEHDKTYKIEQQELQNVETTVEKLKDQFSTLLRIDEENVTLKVKSEGLQNINEDYKKKITQAESSENMYHEKIEVLNTSVIEMETERQNVINERLGIEERIKDLQKELSDDVTEHNALSSKIDEQSAQLNNKNNSLESSLKALSVQIIEESEDKKHLEQIVNTLEGELVQARAISQKSDFELFNYREECNRLTKFYREEVTILEETFERSKEDYKKAEADGEMKLEVKKQLKEMTIHLENKREQCDQYIHQLQDSCRKEIEEKGKVMEDVRIQWEREFRNKELLKTDALVELKEIKAKIVDLQQQRTQIEKESTIKITNMRRCDNLIRKLEDKLKKVAQAAVTSSQSIVEPASQQVKSYKTPPPPPPPRARAMSPESDSSGMTFDPDSVDVKKIFRKRPPLRQLLVLPNKPNQTKKKTVSAPPKPKTEKKDDDDWGFLM